MLRFIAARWSGRLDLSSRVRSAARLRWQEKYRRLTKSSNQLFTKGNLDYHHTHASYRVYESNQYVPEEERYDHFIREACGLAPICSEAPFHSTKFDDAQAAFPLILEDLRVQFSFDFNLAPMPLGCDFVLLCPKSFTASSSFEYFRFLLSLVPFAPFVKPLT